MILRPHFKRPLQPYWHYPSKTNYLPLHPNGKPPPPEFFQEWKETTPKPKAQNSNATPRGPPGRLSPPTVNPTAPSNNRYAILEDLPLTRPPEDKHQKAISPCPSKDQTSAPKKASTNTPPRKSNLASRHSSPGIPTASQPHATLQDAAPQVNSSIASNIKYRLRHSLPPNMRHSLPPNMQRKDPQGKRRHGH
jgi:hypothetical protein